MKALCAPIAAGFMFTALAACAQAPQAPANADTAAPSSTAARAHPTPRATPPAASSATTQRKAVALDASLPKVVVHKSPTCGCCTAWVEHMRMHGFAVTVNDTDALEPIKQRLGVPMGKGSCHTAEVGRYVVEGHVPAQDIKRLIARNDDSRGLVLPGMPAGSPGMEMPDGSVQRYTVERIDAQGATHAFATHGE